MRSKHRQGTTFEFWIPLVHAEAVENRRKHAVSATNVRGIRGGYQPLVLVADDQATNRLFIRLLIERAGYLVAEATDGEEALEMARTERPDIILMDVRMPNMDGLEATRQIRAKLHGMTRTPIIAVTGNAFEEDRKAALDAGCTGFLAKPVDLDELLRCLGEHLEIEYDLGTRQPHAAQVA